MSDRVKEEEKLEILELIELGVLDRDDIGDLIPSEFFEGACVWLHDNSAELCQLTDAGRTELDRLRK